MCGADGASGRSVDGTLGCRDSGDFLFFACTPPVCSVGGAEVWNIEGIFGFDGGKRAKGLLAWMEDGGLRWFISLAFIPSAGNADGTDACDMDGTLGCDECGGGREVRDGAGVVAFAMDCFVAVPLNSEASCVSVSVVEGWRGARADEVVADRRARWRSSAAARMRASRDAVGILKLWGSHLTVSAMRVEFVAGVHTLWQR